LILTALLSAVCIQIATNFFNDALDGEELRDTKDRLGPKRFSSTDKNFLKLIKILAFSLLALAFLLGLILVKKGGLVVLLVGLPALFLAYLYTGTRFSLSTNGIADGFVVLYFGVVPVWTMFFIATGAMSFYAALIGLQCGLLANTLLVINNLRDQLEDERALKKTLVVRYGRAFGLGLLFVCFFTPYFINIYWLKSEFFRAGLWSFLTFPIAAFLFYLVYTKRPSKSYNKYLGLCSLNLLVFCALFTLGLISS
jgi:1,4-dihydroxy-2-naphthoate octaprenyltransferase